MPKATCPCGARYKVPESSIGKRTKCKKCGQVFTLTAEEDEHAILSVAADPVVEDEEVQRMPPPTFHVDRGPAPVVAAAVTRTYLNDVLWAFLFPSTPTNLIAFLIVCVALAVVRPIAWFVPYFGWVLNALLVGWYSAFRFEVIRTAASGEEHLPDVNVTQDIVGDLVAPYFHWLVSWLVVFIPAGVFLVHALSNGTLTAQEMEAALSGGVPGLLNAASGRLHVFLLLVALGLAAWPIVALCLAMGGLSTLGRPDLILRTVLQTVAPYALMLGFMFGAVFLEYLIVNLAGTSLSGTGAAGPAPGAGLILYALGSSAGVYLDIVLMRLIGLHYHHFKARFAWEWE